MRNQINHTRLTDDRFISAAKTMCIAMLSHHGNRHFTSSQGRLVRRALIATNWMTENQNRDSPFTIKCDKLIAQRFNWAKNDMKKMLTNRATGWLHLSFLVNRLFKLPAYGDNPYHEDEHVFPMLAYCAVWVRTSVSPIPGPYGVHTWSAPSAHHVCTWCEHVVTMYTD